MDHIYQTPINRRSTASEFRARAREALKNRWVIAVIVGILAGILGGGGSSPSINFNFNTGNAEELLPPPGQMAEMDWQQIFSEFMESFLAKALLVTVAVSFVFGIAFSLLVGGPVGVGYAQFNLDLIDGKQDTGFPTLFAPFKKCFGKAVCVKLLLTLINLGISLVGGGLAVAVLAPTVLSGFTGEITAAGLTEYFSAPENAMSLLLAALLMFFILMVTAVISVIVTYQYSLCNYILAEYPTLGAVDVLRNSRTLMKGNKWRLFCLEFSFFGWILLAMCTCGIGFLFLSPYMNASIAAFYNEVSQRVTAQEVEFPSIDPEDYFRQ